jgi:hypothetical protein
MLSISVVVGLYFIFGYNVWTCPCLCNYPDLLNVQFNHTVSREMCVFVFFFFLRPLAVTRLYNWSLRIKVR